MAAVIEHPQSRACRADLQGPLADLLFGLSVLADPPIGFEDDRETALRLASAALPLLDADGSAMAPFVALAFSCYAGALQDETIAAGARASVARSELAHQRRRAAVEHVARARETLARLGVEL